MEKTQKKILGLLGLALVVAMTVVAIILPDPKASAVTTTATDVIQLRVLDERPSVDITYPSSDGEVTSLNDQISIDYTNTSGYIVTATYTDEDGEEHTITIADVDTSTEESGTGTVNFRPAGEEYGYGHYVITVIATGLDGSEVSDSVEFDYVAATADATVSGGGSSQGGGGSEGGGGGDSGGGDGGGGQSGGGGDKGDGKNDGTVTVDLHYDTDAADDPGVPEENRIDKFEIIIYDEKGNEVPGVSPIKVTPPETSVVIPFADYDLPTGTYTIVITPYNNRGEALYRTIVLTVYYVEPEVVVPNTADTGGLFGNLNIARADYLITGVGVFVVIGLGSIIFISKKSKATRKRK